MNTTLIAYALARFRLTRIYPLMQQIALYGEKICRPQLLVMN